METKPVCACDSCELRPSCKKITHGRVLESAPSVGLFIEDALIIGPEAGCAFVFRTTLYDAYRQWCAGRGLAPRITYNRFLEAFREETGGALLERRPAKQPRGFEGVIIKQPA